MAARDFLAAAPGAESIATLAQVQRLAGRVDDAIAGYTQACAKNPAYRPLLNAARRTRYWTPSGDEWAALSTKSGPSLAERLRLLHLGFLGILSPDVRSWLVSVAPDTEALPARLRAALDGQFGGRFSPELEAIASRSESLRRDSARRARVTTTSSTLEGELIDSDALLLGSLEVVESDAFKLVPFADLKSMEVTARANWFSLRLVRRDGRESAAETPALYYYTEWCRDPQAREGRVTLWKALTPRLRIGLGLRDFVLAEGGKLRLVGLDTIRTIEFL